MPNATLDGADLPVGKDGNPINLHDWEDHEDTRNTIYDAVKDTMTRQLAAREHNGVVMSVTDIDYADPPYRSIAEQKKALHNDTYLHRRLRGTVTLTDSNTGEVLDSKEMTLMRVPVWTNRGTFIREGNEWGTINQTRLIPGAYSRVQANGDLETQFNVRTGTGGSMRVIFNPEKALYKFKTAGQEFHLYSLLHDIGVSDDEMRASWGDEVFAANADGYDPRTLEKAYNKLVPKWDRDKNPARSMADKVTLIKNALNRAQVARSAVSSTLPNWADRTKAASWARQGGVMQKTASLSVDDLRDVVSYIGEVTGRKVDVECSREELERKLVNIVTTGTENGEVDPSDKAAQTINGMRRARAVSALYKHLETLKGY